MTKITEDAIEQTALEWLENLGYEIAHGPGNTFDGLGREAMEGIANLLAGQIVGGEL